MVETEYVISHITGPLHARVSIAVDRSMNWECFFQTYDKWTVLRSTVFSTFSPGKGNTLCGVLCWIAPHWKESEDKWHTSCTKLQEAIFFKTCFHKDWLLNAGALTPFLDQFLTPNNHIHVEPLKWFCSQIWYETILMCSINFWHYQDSNSSFKGGIGYVTS